MNRYVIPSQSLSVRVVPIAGEPILGKLFLRTSLGRGRETLDERLNHEETPFLPVSLGEEVELVRRSWIAYVEHRGELPEMLEMRELGARQESVALSLANGSTLFGQLLSIAPPERCRLSDVLNNGRSFLPLAGAGRSYYVNRDAVTRARSAVPVTPHRLATVTADGRRAAAGGRG